MNSRAPKLAYKERLLARRQSFSAAGAVHSELSAAELHVLTQIKAGSVASLSTTRPIANSPECAVRAEFIRDLLRHRYGVNDGHTGVHLIGLWITGVLNLKRCRIEGSLTFEKCHFENEPQFHYAKFGNSLMFDGSLTPGLKADGIHVSGETHFRTGFECYGELRLLSAVFGGNVSFRGSILCNAPSVAASESLAILPSVDQTDALCMDRSSIAGNLLLDGNLRSYGKIRLTEAIVGSSIVIENARLDAGTQDYAVSLSRTRIGGSLILRHLEIVRGTINLSSVKTSIFDDDTTAWVPKLNLVNFVYDSFGGGAETTSEQRLKWLKLQNDAALGYESNTSRLKKNPNHYSPQPWNQLIRTLRNSGFRSEAIDLSIARETHERRIEKMLRNRSNARTISGLVAFVFHWVFEKIAGYGYRPSRLVGTLMAVWLSCAMFYWWAALAGAFAPSSPLMFDSVRYETCKGTPNKAARWYLCADIAGEFTTFSPLAFSLDLALPLVDLGQSRDWGVIVRTPYENPLRELTDFELGHLVRFITWFEIIAGWVISLLFVASLSGLAQKKDLQD